MVFAVVFNSRTNDASIKSVTPLDHRGDRLYITHCPVAYQVIFEPGTGQFREFKSPRVGTRIIFVGLSLVQHLVIDCGKRESVS